MTTDKLENAAKDFCEAKQLSFSESDDYAPADCLAFECDGETHIISTAETARLLAEDDIEQSLWEFNYSFLCQYSEIIANIPEKYWHQMSSELCEDFNPAVLAMIGGEDLDALVADAIKADGIGHFLNSYDDKADEDTIPGFVIWRS